MKRALLCCAFVMGVVASLSSVAQVATPMAPQVVDIPTRAGVTQRFLYLAAEQPRAAVVLFAGGNGGLRLESDGRIGSLQGNFLVRSRLRFVEQGLAVAVIDAPSDRLQPPYLEGYRQTSGHVEDVKAVIAWLRDKTHVPVWLIGTSRGTQSVAYIATELPRERGGPDGLVLSSTILVDKRGRAVPYMALDRIAIPVVVVHHQDDACALCPYSETANLMKKLTASPRTELITITGGESRGDPCEAFAHHGYNGQEADVVAKIGAGIGAR